VGLNKTTMADKSSSSITVPSGIDPSREAHSEISSNTISDAIATKEDTTMTALQGMYHFKRFLIKKLNKSD
jgi:hypothetical protein